MVDLGVYKLLPVALSACALRSEVAVELKKREKIGSRTERKTTWAPLKAKQ